MARALAYRLAVYTFVVFMILLRPYSAYYIAMQGGQLARDPDQVSRLLQRLVKKKEWHIDDHEETMELLQENNVEITLPVLLLLFFRRRLSWLHALLNETALNWKRSTIFQVSPPTNYLQLISRLQV
jgi:hypothetical protein